MPLTVLSDSDVRTLLLQLTKQDILALQQSLADALHYYSTATVEDDDNGCCEAYQPKGTSLKSKDGAKMDVVPASSNDGLGVKITTLLNDKKTPTSSDTESLSSSLDTLSLSHGSSTTAVSSHANSTTAKGSLTLFDRTGNPRALLNTSELTAFRTALASTMLFKKRQNVHDVTVFGSGKQAYWHIRLSLLLRGPDIHHLNIINRDFERVHHLLERLYNPHEAPQAFNPDPSLVPSYRRTEPHESLSRPKIQILTPNHGEYTRLLKETIRSSSVIYTCTSSPTPLFPASILTSPEGRRKGRYLSSIALQACELAPEILQQAVAPAHQHRHFHKHATSGGAVVIDSIEACLKEAGEVVQAGLKPEQVVEIGELVMLKRDADRRRAECQSKKDEGLDDGGVELGETKKSKKKEKERRGSSGGKKEKGGEEEDKAHQGLMEWLTKGNVVYKSVGLGLMDVVVGGDLVSLADERGIGTRIDDF
jgi:ornithine cyclodeaminase/alanine dehydrogenase-like protein (mu-crystallin family)